MPEWFTIHEVAERWRKSKDTINRWIRTGRLKAMSCGASYLVHRTAALNTGGAH